MSPCPCLLGGGRGGAGMRAGTEGRAGGWAAAFRRHVGVVFKNPADHVENECDTDTEQFLSHAHM